MAEYIERDKVMDALLHEQYGYLCEDAINGIPTAVVYEPHEYLREDAINSIHASDVRPVVRGKWRLYSPLTDTYECDKCGYQVIDESFRTNFCPNCGAKMREIDDEKA